MDGLSDQEKYRYLQREAAGYTVNLQSAGTGAEVQSWAEKIKADQERAARILARGIDHDLLERIGIVAQLGGDGMEAVNQA